MCRENLYRYTTKNTLHAHPQADFVRICGLEAGIDETDYPCLYGELGMRQQNFAKIVLKREWKAYMERLGMRSERLKGFRRIVIVQLASDRAVHGQHWHVVKTAERKDWEVVKATRKAAAVGPRRPDWLACWRKLAQSSK